MRPMLYGQPERSPVVLWVMILMMIADNAYSFSFILVIFLKDICQIANVSNESVNAYFWNFMNKIFHILMYNLCIHKPIYHTQTPKYPEHSPMNLFDSLLTITYGCLPNLEKPLVIQHEFPFTGHTQYTLMEFWQQQNPSLWEHVFF